MREYRKSTPTPTTNQTLNKSMFDWLDSLFPRSKSYSDLKFHYVEVSANQLREAFLPDFHPEDWRSLVRQHHLYECSGRTFEPNQRFDTTDTSYRQLTDLSNQKLTPEDTSGFLFEVAIARDYGDLDELVTNTYAALNLRPPLPNGLLDYLLPVLNERHFYTLGEQAYLVYELLENRHHSRWYDKPPGLTKPYLELFSAAWGVCKLEYWEDEELAKNFREYEAIRNQICVDAPDVTEPFNKAQPS